MSLRELQRIGQDFDLDGEIFTEHYYSGTHQIVLSGDCVDPALDALEDIGGGVEIFFYDEGQYCYVVAPGLNEKHFFEQVVSVVESAVAGIADQDGSYSVKRKLPASPQLPEKSNVVSERVDGVLCYSAPIHLGRGYGTRYSQVDILLSHRGRRIFYRVTRFNNDVAGPQQDGEARIFSGKGAQWQAVCFAYGIQPVEGETKEAAQRAKRFVFKMAGLLMYRFWSDSTQSTQPSYLQDWQQSQTASPVLA